MFSLANAKSYNSRTDVEVYAALQEGGFYVYSAVLKEFRGTFLKVDSTSLSLAIGVTEYTLPADVSQLLGIAERQSSSENWHEMDPEDIQDAINNVQQDLNYFDYGFNYGEKSQFRFYGPYLDSVNAQNSPSSAQVQKIRISPAPSESRYVQLAYGAKWLPIVNAGSKVMLPDEGTYAMQNYAVAELLRSNDDTLAREYEGKADKSLTAFLSWMRVNNSVRPRQIRAYLS